MNGPPASARLLLIALGHSYRRDDAAGAAVIDAVTDRDPGCFGCLHHSGDPSDLIDRWHGRDTILVDAAPATDLTGCFQVFEPIPEPGAALDRSALERVPGSVGSTHALSLAQALELAMMLDRLPRTLSLVAVAGEDFGFGDGLTPGTHRAVSAATRWLLAARFPSSPCA